MSHVLIIGAGGVGRVVTHPVRVSQLTNFSPCQHRGVSKDKGGVLIERCHRI